MKRIVFCDFDGTITQAETFVAMLREFTPVLSERLLPEIYAKRLTLRDGVRQFIQSIPAARYGDIIEFTRSQPIRPGLLELLDFLESKEIPFVVISGGLMGMVESVLNPLRHRIYAIHAMEVDTREQFLQVHSAYESETEIVAKAQIMAKYNADQSIAIGDSITDLNLALAAEVVFARPPLTRYLEERNKAFIPWSDFFEVQDYLRDHVLGGSFEQSLRTH
ncbi:HAD-IB family phosphatase [Leptolyngbya sp. FACHB-17]|uniref:HAD-IB family phosphatase n=1 Tax=unclassified Leptolyngbya TaxID=2650499 RepID=UPI001680FAAE|nr:HAD-IB family phosphatase [Leptolyngbya sp. FACHB-17]MBD2081859.1 HAD-IB family phosphatase [Leptolyngbya sp. FACHB-17]